MAGTRKIATILVADIVGYSGLAAVDDDRTLSRLRGLRSDRSRHRCAPWPHRQANRRNSDTSVRPSQPTVEVDVKVIRAAAAHAVEAKERLAL